MTTEVTPCQPAGLCESVFNRLVVFPLITGCTLVQWSLRNTFKDPGPYSFQLQVSPSAGLAEADDWHTIGSPILDEYQAEDPYRREYAQRKFMAYRVRLDTSAGTYYSETHGADGYLSKRDWLKVRNELRIHQQRLAQVAGTEGYLLRRRVVGTSCPDCLAAVTNEVEDANCPTCYGTKIVGGYYPPKSCVYAELLPSQTRTFHNLIDPKNQEATIPARLLNIPPLFSYDVWVNRFSDERYYIHDLHDEVVIRGITLVRYPVILRRAHFKDIVYSFPISGQVPS